MQASSSVPKSVGYQFHPPEHENAPGGLRLDMLICRESPALWAALEQVRLTVASKEGLPEELTLYHPWTFVKTFRVCPGKVVLIDRRAEQLSAFTFGGDLRIQAEHDETAITLSSPTPILRLDNRVTRPPTLLANEVEIILAERCAEWLPNQSVFKRRLASQEPEVLYAACLLHLVDKFEACLHEDMPHLLDFLVFLQAEIESLKETQRWPTDVPELAALL